MSRLFDPAPQFTDDDGAPLASGSLTFYRSTTTTFQNTYSDRLFTTANVNPLPLDADGRTSAECWLDDTKNYRVILKDSTGAVIWDIDPFTQSLLSNVSITGGVFTTSTLTGGYESFTTATWAGAQILTANENVNLNATLTGNTTITLNSSFASGLICAVVLRLIQGGTGNYTVTWPAKIHWAGGTAPALSTAVGKKDTLLLTSWDGGTTFDGLVVCIGVA